MKKTSLAAGMAIALTGLVGGTALAQTADRPDVRLRADADGDRRISRAEFVARRIDRLTAIDANRDGSVSTEEMRSGIDTRRNQRVSARFETLDNDGNGAVTREEFTAAAEARGQRAGRGGRMGMAGRTGQRGGGERGDRVSVAGPIVIADASTRLAARFDRIDTDRDGFVTVEEQRVVREGMREQRRARRAVRQPSPPTTSPE